jgi:hypothetical protein
MISFLSASGGGGSGGAAASPPKKSILSKIKKPLIIILTLIIIGLFFFYLYAYIKGKIKQTDDNREKLVELQNTVKKLQIDVETLKKAKPPEISVRSDIVPPSVNPPEIPAATQSNEKPLQNDLKVFKIDNVGELWKETGLIRTDIDVIKEKCCNEAEPLRIEIDALSDRLNKLNQADFNPQNPKKQNLPLKEPETVKPIETSERPVKKLPPKKVEPAKRIETSDRPVKKNESASRFGKSVVVPKEDESGITATICFNDPVRVLSGQVLIRLSGLVPGPLASFDLTLPNSNTHYLRVMETGSRRPFECNHQGYFFDFMGIEGNCAKIEITKRLSF